MRRDPLTRANSSGFTLIELMAVVAILGILAAIAIGAYSKNVRNARRTEVIGDLGAIALKERTVFAVRGHYVTTSSSEDDTYPVAPAMLKTIPSTIEWGMQDEGYTRKSQADDDGIFDGGGDEHGWDALSFMPEGAESWCAYGAISGAGTNGVNPVTPADIAGSHPLGDEVFPIDTPAQQAYFARDWFYAFAKCDLDRDGVYWDFTIAHFSSDVSTGDGTRTGE
jgi:prepilin-type N-terminal cleavage/methylation domain-containing protein